MHLSDCFVNLMAGVAYMLPHAEKHGTSYEVFRDSVMGSVDECTLFLSQDGVKKEDFTEAQFAVLCWIDDRVMQSTWAGKRQWQRESLQRLYFKTSQGGAEFFSRLSEIDPFRSEVLEVYCLCLFAGFRGRYALDEDERTLYNLKSGVRNKLVNEHEKVMGTDGGKIFADIYQAANLPVAGRRDHPMAVALRGALLFSPALLCGALFVVYRFILNSEMMTSLVP